MKKYKYRLEALLKMKEHFEKEKQKTLAISTKKVMDQKDNLSAISASKSTTLDHQRQLTGGNKFSVAELLVVSRYINKLKRDNLVGNEMLKVLQREEDARREELLAASRERKKYEKLKERQKDKFNKEIEQVLKKENDEIAVNNYRKQKHN